MLIVETIGRIRREHFVQGKSIKEIARTLKLSRNTVRKFFGLRTRRLPDGSGVGLSQKGHFYEGLFDWIEVRRIGRQEEELGLGVRVVNTATRAVVQVGKHGTRLARAAVDESRIAGLDETRPHPNPDEGGTEIAATDGFAATEDGRRHRHWPMDERDLRAPDRQLLEHG